MFTTFGYLSIYVPTCKGARRWKTLIPYEPISLLGSASNGAGIIELEGVIRLLLTEERYG